MDAWCSDCSRCSLSSRLLAGCFLSSSGVFSCLLVWFHGTGEVSFPAGGSLGKRLVPLHPGSQYDSFNWWFLCNVAESNFLVVEEEKWNLASRGIQILNRLWGTSMPFPSYRCVDNIPDRLSVCVLPYDFMSGMHYCVFVDCWQREESMVIVGTMCSCVLGGNTCSVELPNLVEIIVMEWNPHI